MSDLNKQTTAVLHVFNDFLEAHDAKNRLQERGIESFMLDENAVGLNPLGGVELKVFIEDMDRAKAVLAEM
ncbi:MAG TPA: DUF2007 domain-containing protein [Saprospiraceae bacterium]|nr:DUF2007 domain-containing protein [Saprospiraceae bacterium]